MLLASALSAVIFMTLVNAQAVDFCKAEGCEDCPSSITTDGTGYSSDDMNCVIYDSNTVFRGLGFEAGVGDILFEVYGNFPDPGPSCNTIIRSPASLTSNGCGNLIHQTTEAQCSTAIEIQDTFFVQFCCGEGDCTAAGVPFKRGVAGHSNRGSSGGLQGVELRFKNGTVIPPKEIGHAPEQARRNERRQCDGYMDGSYVANGDPYLKTFDTQIVSSSLGPFTVDTDIMRSYDQSVSRTTTFDSSIGDPFGIVSVSVGYSIEDSMSSGVVYTIPVPAGTVGQAGFTPVFRCTSGSLQTCSNGPVDGETCTPYVLNGIVQGDYTLVSS